jgi:hypothetical protein
VSLKRPPFDRPIACAHRGSRGRPSPPPFRESRKGDDVTRAADINQAFDERILTKMTEARSRPLRHYPVNTPLVAREKVKDQIGVAPDR